MCLSTAYKLENGNRVVLGSYVYSIEIDGDSIKLTTLMGEEITLTGFVKNVDLIKNEILIAS